MRKLELIPQTAEVPLPKLAGIFFDTDGEPVWKLRQLNHFELLKVREAGQGDREQIILAVADALATGGDQRAQAIKDLIGSGDGVPPELAKMILSVELGTTAPEIDHDDVLMLFEHWPADAMLLAQKVLQLTGEGATLGKSPASTTTRASPSPSDSENSNTKVSTN